MSPLDIELYKKADSLPSGKDDPEFKKKPEIAVNLIDKTLSFRFVKWLNQNWDVFSAYKASLGFVWA